MPSYKAWDTSRAKRKAIKSKTTKSLLKEVSGSRVMKGKGAGGGGLQPPVPSPPPNNLFENYKEFNTVKKVFSAPHFESLICPPPPLLTFKVAPRSLWFDLIIDTLKVEVSGRPGQDTESFLAKHEQIPKNQELRILFPGRGIWH